VKIVDLARDLIVLSGLRPDQDIEIRFSGMRPGEKLFEELSTATEHADKTRHPKVFTGRIKPHEWEVVVQGVEALLELADSASPERVRTVLGDVVPEYSAARPPTKHDAEKEGARAGRSSGGIPAIVTGPSERSAPN
jgi:FlaA1/EpsC-like NDP-sugar epimerase